MNRIKKYMFSQLNGLPEKQGIYAWYYKPTIPAKDIENLEERVLKLETAAEKQEEIRIFLMKFIFNPFQEVPYTVKITGKLKPTYQGQVPNTFILSDSMLKYFSDSPSQLKQIAKYFVEIDERFLSPIYMGMCRNQTLKKRLNQHKDLILKYKDLSTLHDSKIEEFKENMDDANDHTFAYEVAKIRKFNSTRLFCITYEFERNETNNINFFENILNRINYPLCGRN